MNIAAPSPSRSWLAPPAQQAAVFGAYVVTARLGMLLAFPGTNASAVWPPTGIALGAALLLGWRIWPAIALGALVTNLITLSGLGLAPHAVLGVALTTTLGNTLEALVGATLVRRATGGRDPLANPSDSAAFIIVGAMLASTISATIGVWGLSAIAGGPGIGAQVWVTWWLGDAAGALVVAPLVLTWSVRPRSWPRERVLEMIAMLSLMGFFIWGLSHLGPLARFLFIPLFVWAGTRFGRFECAIVALFFAAGSTLATVFGTHAWPGLTANGGLLNQEAYLAIVVSSLLLLSSLVHRLDMAQKATEASEQRYRNLFEMHGSVMLVHDPVRGIVLDANPAAAAFYGYPLQQLRGMPMREIIALPAAEHTRLRDQVVRGELKEIVTTHRLASGEGRRVEVRASHVGSGKELTILAIITDVTERERVERMHELLGAVVGSSDDAILSKDLEGRILSWNSGAERIYGYSAAEVIGQSISLIIPPERSGEFAQVMEELRAGRGVRHLETERLRRDGLTIAVSLTISPLRDPTGHVFGASTIARDVTERNALAERLLHSQKLESLGTMAGGVAHDFNNILTAIIGYTDLMKLDMCTECKLRPYLVPIESASAQARRLTGSLLAFSRKHVMSPGPNRVNELVQTSAGLLSRLIGENFNLVLNLDPANPTVLVDRGQIDQVLMNLATNARDAMPEGGTLTISTSLCGRGEGEHPEKATEGSAHVRIAISDTGTGVSESTRERIFEPFFTTKVRGKGTGLGLAIAHGIVEQHGGSLRLEPDAGPGATFTLTLPVIEASEAAAAEEAFAELPYGDEFILLVEDNSEVRTLGRSILERHGYRVIEAADGQAAIEVLTARIAEIDLVLSDVVMPRRSGRDVFEAARALRPDLPFILTSGHVAEAVPLEWVRKDGRDFLPKPSTPGQLLRLVREVLDRAR